MILNKMTGLRIPKKVRIKLMITTAINIFNVSNLKQANSSKLKKLISQFTEATIFVKTKNLSIISEKNLRE